jgi:hypothetical protein
MSLFEGLVLFFLLVIAIEVSHARRLLATIYQVLLPVIESFHQKNMPDDDE